MAENIELRLIAKIVNDGNFREALKSKMNIELLSVGEARSMFQTIWEYYHNPKHPGRVPTRRLMEKRHPGFIPMKRGKETIAELVEEIREASITRKILEVIETAEEEVREDPYGTLERLRGDILSIQGMTATSRDLYLHEAYKDIKREYALAKSAEGIMGVPWPWERFNDETNGMLPEDLIIIYGRMKSMKTFVGCAIAAHAYIGANRRVLFYSAEMSPPQIMKRLACAIAEVDYKAMKKGELRRDQEQSLYDMLDQVAADEEADREGGHKRSLLVTSDKDDARGMGGISHVQAKAEEFEPDLIIVDSFYRLRDDRSGKNDYDWKIQSSIAQDLKHLAQRLRVPVIGITQANRSSIAKQEGEGMDDVSYSDAIGQEADLGLRIVKGGKDPYGVHLKVVVAAAREIEMSGFKLLMKPFTCCKFNGVMEQAPEEEMKDRSTKVKKNELIRSKREANSDRAALQRLAEKGA
jgi:replicative DNA helicase